MATQGTNVQQTVNSPSTLLVESGDLATLVWKKDELLRRMKLLLETKTLAGLTAALPNRIETHNAEDYERMEQFIRRIQIEISKICERIAAALNHSAPDRSDVPSMVNQNIGIFQAEVRKYINDLGVKSNGKTMEAIRSAEGEMTGALSFQDLEETTLLMTLEKILPNARLSADQFMVVQEKPKPQVSISFHDSQSNLWTAALQKKEQEAAAIPKFRWSWTDDELFAKKKLPQAMEYTHSYQEIEEIWNETAETLIGGFKEWKQQCRTQIAPSQVFTKKSGGSLRREEALQKLETAFTEHLFSEVQRVILDGLSPNKPLWINTIKKTLPSIIENLESYCHIQDGPAPVFIAQGLSDFFQKATQASPRKHAFVQEEYIESEIVESLWLFHRRSISRTTTPRASVMRKLIGSGALGEHGKFQSKLSEKVLEENEQRLKGNTKHSVRTAIVSLEKEIEESLERILPEEHQEHSRLEYVQLWKEATAACLEVISKFQCRELSESMLMQIRNAASFLIAWESKDTLYRIGLMDEWENDATYREAAERELKDFYPTPPAQEKIGIPTMTITEIGEWLAQVRETALQQLSITCNNIPDADATSLKEKISQTIKSELLQVSLTKFMHPGKTTIITDKNDVVDLATHCMSAVSRLPKSIRVEQDSYELPEELGTFLQTQIGMMVDTLCQKYGWSKEGQRETESPLKTKDEARTAPTEVVSEPTVTFTWHEKLLANISPFSMRWLAKKSKTVEQLAFDVFHPLSIAELCTLFENTLNQWRDAELLRMEQWVKDLENGRITLELFPPAKAHGIDLKFKRWLKEAGPYLRMHVNKLIQDLVQGLAHRADVPETTFFDGIRNEINTLVYAFDKRKRDKWLSIPTDCLRDAIGTLEKQIDVLKTEALALARIPQSERPDTKKDQKKKRRNGLSRAEATSNNQPTQNQTDHAVIPQTSNEAEKSLSENEENPGTHDAVDDESTEEHETIADLFAVYDIEMPRIGEALSHATADHLSRIATHVLMEHGSQLPSEELERVTEELRTRIGKATARIHETCKQHEGQSFDRDHYSQAIIEAFNGVLESDRTLPENIEESMRVLVEEAEEKIADSDNDETFIEQIMEGATNGATELEEAAGMLRSALETQNLQVYNQEIERLDASNATSIQHLSVLSKALIERAQQATTEPERASAFQEAERLQTFIQTLVSMYLTQEIQAASDQQHLPS